MTIPIHHYRTKNIPERGAILPLIAAISLPLLTLIALAIDGFILFTYKLQQENNAEFAAVSIISEAIKTENFTTPASDPITTAQAIRNAVTGQNRYITQKTAVNSDGGTSQFGNLTSGLDFIPSAGACTALPNCAVRVRLQTSGGSTPIIPFFAGLLGFESFATKSEAIAYVAEDNDALVVRILKD